MGTTLDGLGVNLIDNRDGAIGFRLDYPDTTVFRELQRVWHEAMESGEPPEEQPIEAFVRGWRVELRNGDGTAATPRWRLAGGTGTERTVEWWFARPEAPSGEALRFEVFTSSNASAPLLVFEFDPEGFDATAGVETQIP